jgi:Mn-containing catalase
MSDTKLSNEFQESINRLREKNEKSIKVISKKHFMSKDMVDKVLTKHPHWKIETECKWRKEAIRDADEYGDDANSVDFWKSEYVEIFNDMMSQYHPYSY